MLPEPAWEEDYQRLLRSLRWAEGFGLFFVQCTPAQADRIVSRVRKDISSAHVELFALSEPVDSLYERIKVLTEKKKVDFLFIRGLEKSLVKYIGPGYGGEGDYYREDSVPRLLGHLNLQRERFRENFPFQIIFLMPKFALKYFIRRAPDFFDWRSGVFEFPADKDILEHENKQILDEEFHELYKLPSIDLDKKILVIKALLEEPKQEVDSRLNLQQRLGDLFLVKGCFQDACASYDKVLAINPEYAGTWGNRGISLGKLGRLEEALASFDKVLAINPEDAHAWFNRGNALGKLGRLEEAVISYDKALAINPKDARAWINRGIDLGELGRLEEAVVSYAKALAINPEDARAWFNKACALALQNDVDSAIENLRKAIDLDSKCQQDAAVDPDFAQIRNHPRFRLLLAGESRPKTNSSSPDLEVNQSSSDGADGKTPSKNQDPEMGSQAEDGFIFRE